MSRRPFCVPSQAPSLEKNVADLDGSVVLPMAAHDFVLTARLELHYQALRMAPLANDLPGNGGLGSVAPGQQLGLVGAYCQNMVEGDLGAHMTLDEFHLHGLARCNAILLTPATNDGVHAALPGK